MTVMTPKSEAENMETEHTEAVWRSVVSKSHRSPKCYYNNYQTIRRRNNTLCQA
jgi:hypothetical protein